MVPALGFLLEQQNVVNLESTDLKVMQNKTSNI